MTLDEFQQSLDFLGRSGVKDATLLGGEPTIHPNFCEMVDLALSQDFRVLVLSGGVIPEKVLHHLEQTDPGRVSMMLNVIPPVEGYSQRDRDCQSEVMRRFGSRLALGINIDSPTVPLDFLLDYIAEYSLEPIVRMGLAHPIAGGMNSHLHPRDYPAVGRQVADFAFRAQDAGVHLEFDCGWVPCMFPDGALESLGITPHQIGLRCNPIIDILPGLQTISCYPLASVAKAPLPVTEDGPWLADHYTTALESHRPLMLYRHCTSCDWLARGECVGGCIAGSMKRLRSANSLTA